MKLEALDHPKTFDLAARLGIELPTAIGHLALLWAFVGKKAPQGDVGKWPDGAIARACHWMARPETFIQALRDAGFLDADPVHRLTVHDWHEHCPRWVLAKLGRSNLRIIDPGGGGGDCSGDCSGDSVREGKLREGKGRGPRASARDPATEGGTPPGLHQPSWHRWVAYRATIRKPLKSASIAAAMRALAAFGDQQAAVVEQSIAQGWQGLFAVKSQHGQSQHGQPAQRPGDEAGARRVPTDEQRQAADRMALERSARGHGIDPSGLTESAINNLIFRQRAEGVSH